MPWGGFTLHSPVYSSKGPTSLASVFFRRVSLLTGQMRIVREKLAKNLWFGSGGSIDILRAA